MAASNTKDCFRECIGKKVVGIIFDALPYNRRELAAGTKTLVFEDGTGLTIADNGSFWTENVEEVKRAIGEIHTELLRTKADIEDVLRVAGELLPAPTA